MNFLRHWTRVVALCVCLSLTSAACSGEPDGNPGAETDSGHTEDGGADAADAGSDADTGPKTDSGSDADADTRTDVDSGTATGLILQGELVPTGGMSLSQSFTLSGHLSPGMPKQKSASASFQLELTPATGETTNAN